MDDSNLRNARYWQERYSSMEKRLSVVWNKALDAAEIGFGIRHRPMCSGKVCLICSCSRVLDSVRKPDDSGNDKAIIERLADVITDRRKNLKIRGIARDKHLEGMRDMLKAVSDIIGDIR